MEPRIGRSLAEGFRAANRSWLGIGFFAGVWLVVILIVGLAIVLTAPPTAVFEGAAGRVQAPQPEEAFSVDATVPTAEDAPGDLFDQLETPADQQPASSPTPEQGGASPTTPAPEVTQAAPAQAQSDTAAQEVADWFKRAWPVVVICVLLVIAANIWLTGGQIGYLAKRVSGQPTQVSEFWIRGTQAFGALLGASLLSFLGIALLAVVVLAIGALFSAIGKAAPTWLMVTLTLLAALAATAALIWLIVRLSLWFLVIVVERRGPLAGLKAGFAATRGRWWRLAGLGVSIVLISYAVMLGLGLLELLGNAVGGAFAVALGILSGLASLMINLFLGFMALAAYLRFFQDLKSTQPAA